MADNFPLTPGSGRNAATDQVTYSGDTADVQLVKLVDVAGAEGSKTVDPHGLATQTTLQAVADALDLIKLAIFNEDSAHTTGDRGIPAWAVRTDTAIARAGTDGDYIPLIVDSSGRLHVNVGAIANVTIGAALPAGTNAIGKLAANSGVDIGDVDVTSIGAGSNLIGDVAIQGRTTGGLSIFRSIDLDESEEEVKATAGTLYAIHCVNLHASSKRYLKFYNDTAANVVVGTTTPVLTLPIPAATGGAGFTWNIPQGLAFGTAICAAATTGVADNDTGAPGVNEVVIALGYK